MEEPKPPQEEEKPSPIATEFEPTGSSEQTESIHSTVESTHQPVTTSPAKRVPSHKTVLKDTRRRKGAHSKKGFFLICLSALGIVYGDIGTSPLYVMKSVFTDPPGEDDVIEVISLVFWALTLVVCIKYLVFVMRADYNGEGGVFALLSQILYGNNRDHDSSHEHDPRSNVASSHTQQSSYKSIKRSPSEAAVGSGSASAPHHDNSSEEEEIDPAELKLEHVDSKQQAQQQQQQRKDDHSISVQDDRSEPVSLHEHSSWIAYPKVRKMFVLLAMVGSGLLLGDGVITPAISVLSAVEGLTVISPDLHPAVVPITCVILILLFAGQRFGTAKVGVLFGPIMVLWFIILTIMGIYQIAQHPAIFSALNPYRAIEFFIRHGQVGWESLGAVVLCITGCEAMFADMGHFGKNAVRVSWMCFVYPALVFNYLGQGALLVRTPEAIVDPFFNMIPRPLFWPVFIVSIAATVIASQALISGAFSLTQQAVRLGYFPRLQIVHTSAYVEGQIYIPSINFMLMVCAVILVAGFQSSANLASAYGLAVCGDMTLTSFMFLSLARFRWNWHTAAIAWLAIQFFVVDFAFFTSNLLKVPNGGWFPLLFALLVFTTMFIWYIGERVLHDKIRRDQVPFEEFVENLKTGQISRCPGIGVFMSAVEQGVPSALSQFLAHMPVLPETTVFLTLKRLHSPYVPLSRSRVIALPEGCVRIVLETGFMESKISVEELSEVTLMHGIGVQVEKGTFFLGNEQVAARKGSWFGRKFVVDFYNLLLQYSHSSTAATFRIPPKNVVYVGSHYSL